MPNSLVLDAPPLQILLTIAAFLFVCSIFRIFFLSRDNRVRRKDLARMAKTSVEQQADLLAIHDDMHSLREKMRRQFDALRADLVVRLQQSEQGNTHAQKQLDETLEKMLAEARAKIAELEKRLVPAVPAAAPKPPPPTSLPSLPAMETLRVQALESELATAKAELTSLRQQNSLLQRSLLLARRRQPAARKESGRPSR